MTTTYTNGGITIQKNLIFGWSILTDEGWLPLEMIDEKSLDKLLGILTQDIFPMEVWEYVKDRLKELKKRPDDDLIYIL